MEKKRDTYNQVITQEKFDVLLSSLLPSKKIEKIAIAVSGGIDSMVLTLLARQWCKKRAIQLIAFTVDHKLRKGSTEEANKVHQWLESYGIEHAILTLAGKKIDSNIQGRAREARYQLLAGQCKAAKISFLLVAHHKEDQAETFLLRLERGSGIDGLSAMVPLHHRGGVTLVRPLLSVPKACLKAYAALHHIPSVEDPSNRDPGYRRVFFRQILEAMEDKELFIHRVCETAVHMARAKSYIALKVAEDQKHVVTLLPEGYAFVTLPGFFALHEEAALRVLVQLLCAISGNPYKPRFEEVYRLYQSITRADFKAKTLYGCFISRMAGKQKDKLLFCREIAAIGENVPVHARETVLWDRRFFCTLKKPFKGAFIGCLGNEVTAGWIERHKKGKENMPKKVLYGVPVLRTLEKILAVPHINYYSEDIEAITFRCTFHVNMVQDEEALQGESYIPNS